MELFLVLNFARHYALFIIYANGFKIFFVPIYSISQPNADINFVVDAGSSIFISILHCTTLLQCLKMFTSIRK
uniref:Uncharacterized protein n=1 Tax=Pararge aegeria TaxID=116150 RepID=S4NQI9_9NEOP